LRLRRAQQCPRFTGIDQKIPMTRSTLASYQQRGAPKSGLAFFLRPPRAFVRGLALARFIPSSLPILFPPILSPRSLFSVTRFPKSGHRHHLTAGRFCPQFPRKKGASKPEPSLVLGERFVPGGDGRHFCQPTSVLVMPSGEIVVADGYCNDRILLLGPEGRLLGEFSAALLCCFALLLCSAAFLCCFPLLLCSASLLGLYPGGDGHLLPVRTINEQQ
jgi:hypothetical protein